MQKEIEKIGELEPITFDVKEEVISQMERDYLPLKLAGVNDKDGYAKIVEYRKKTKSLRVSVEKRRQDLKRNILDYGREVDRQANEIKSRLEKVESHLQEQEDIVKKEKERIEAEKQRQRDEKRQSRINSLIAAGAAFTGLNYVYGAKSVTPEQIELMPDPEFDFAVKEIELLKKEDDQKKADEEKRQQEERERQEKIAEENRKRQEEIERKEREQAEREAKLKAEEERIAQQRTQSRCEKLISLGLTYDFRYDSFLFLDVNVAMVEAKTMDDSEWANLIEKIIPVIAERKAQQEKEAAEKAEAERKEREEKHAQELKAAEEKRLADIKAAEAKAKAEAEEKERKRIEAEQAAKAEAEKQAALRPDKEKIIAFINMVLSLEMPNIKDDALRDILGKASTQIDAICQGVKSQLK